jgi:ketosteroid isomerase-like protein
MKLRIYTIFAVFLCVLAGACSGRKQSPPQPIYEYGEHRDTLMLEVRTAIIASMNRFNNDNMNDSATFEKFLSFYDSTFVVFGKPGTPPVAGTIVFDTLRQFVKHAKPKIFISFDRIEASQDLAYALYHYRETASDRETGGIILDGNRSACMVLRKDSMGDWKCVALTWL